MADPAGAKRRRRFEINLDVIENSFEAGELVTLDALKRRNIAPKRAEHLKILARGALSKPLMIMPVKVADSMRSKSHGTRFFQVSNTPVRR